MASLEYLLQVELQIAAQFADVMPHCAPIIEFLGATVADNLPTLRT